MENKTRPKKRRFDTRKKFGEKKKLCQLVEEEITEIRKNLEKFTSAQATSFASFPLSKRTHQGLEAAKFSIPTEIQKQAIPLALRGNDILGAAKTGSGKTLAFLIPVLEKLYSLKWSQTDGLGALILTPTRELAFQIFEVLKQVGKYHSDFSAGLVNGGIKNFKAEAKCINNTNIVVATIGRFLQHMSETPLFTESCCNLQILVLDEADRMLDDGNKKDLTEILNDLPSDRQTLLFSATQTKSVSQLARLSLKDPIYVSVHEHAARSTPANLKENYIVCDAEDKLSFIWSFIKSHLSQKILVFLQSCKQVRFVYESFCRLRPGMTVLELNGQMKQDKRVAMFESFKRKQSAILFATDVASRGLDFPEVHWVIQLDCPENVDTYIHRVGRTARYTSEGQSILVLSPSEESAMVEQLSAKKIPIEKIRVNPKNMQTITPRLAYICASDVTLKEFAQRAFVSYMKSICLMSNKAVFDVRQINTEKFASSLGLAITPRVRFAEKRSKQLNEREAKKIKLSDNATTKKLSSDESEHSDMEVDDKNESDKWNNGSDDDDTEDVFVKKDKPSQPVLEENEEKILLELSPIKRRPKKILTKVQLAKKQLKKACQFNNKIVYDDDGNPLLDQQKAQLLAEEPSDEILGIEERRKIMQQQDSIDKQLHRERIKQEKLLKKIKLKKMNQDNKKSKRKEVSDDDSDEDSES